MDENIEPLVWDVPRIAAKLGVCKATVKRLIREGRLKAKKQGKRYVCLPEQVEKFIQSLPKVQPKKEAT